MTTFKVTTQATPLSFVYDIEATMFIEFKIASLRMAINLRLIERHSLKDTLATPKALNENRRLIVQHIEAIQQKKKSLTMTQQT